MLSKTLTAHVQQENMASLMPVVGKTASVSWGKEEFKENICMEFLFLNLETICALDESGCKSS